MMLMVLCIANSSYHGRRRIAGAIEYRATCAFAYSVANARDSGNDGSPFRGFVADEAHPLAEDKSEKNPDVQIAVAPPRVADKPA